MIARQAYALLMAHANGKEPVRGRTRLQKMMFLLWKGMEGEGAFRGSDSCRTTTGRARGSCRTTWRG